MAIRKYKKEDEYSYTLGTTLTIELLVKHPELVNLVFLHSKINHNEAYDKIVSLCKQNNIRIEPDSDNVFQTISDKDNCFAIAQFKKYQMVLEQNANHILLCNPSNGGNLGTILRSCLGFGVDNIAIITPSTDIFDPKTIRSSMGAIFSLNVQLFNSIDEYVSKFSNRELYPFMLQASKSLTEVNVDNNKNFTLMFGTEASGLPRECLNMGTPVIIKHSNKIDSLNIANSVSIALFYFTKDMQS